MEVVGTIRRPLSQQRCMMIAKSTRKGGLQQASVKIFS
jgi:hypothetical protein